MNFVTLSFAFFFIFVLAMHAFVRKGTWPYKTLLLGLSGFFYASAGLTFLPLLCLVAVLNWGTARLLYTYAKKTLFAKVTLGINVFIHVCLLVFYKYYEFFLVNVELALNAVGLQLPMYDIIANAEFLFPVGLSFYTFQGLSYAIDQYRDKTKPESLLNVAVFVSFFPTILAGPILRAKDFFPQLRGEAVPNTPLVQKYFLPEHFEQNVSLPKQDVLLGFTFILSGLFKKVVLASYLSEHIVRDVFLTPDAYASVTVLMAVYAYAMQIYCDFSGYSDMAVGVGCLMGYRLPQNFNAPYLACNLQDFWRRWHITLSSWLRDYLYIPLGGNKRGNKTVNLILTMTIGGLWHGAHLRFLIWGIMHGIGLSLVHFWHWFCKLCKIFDFNEASHTAYASQTSSLSRFFKKTYAFLGWFVTFHFVCILWIFFRADTAEIAMQIIERIALWDKIGEGFALLVPVAIVLTMLTQIFGARLFKVFVACIQKVWLPVQAVVFAILCALILKLGPDGVLPFIYFQF